MAIEQWRKKPVVIEAMRLTYAGRDGAAKWCGGTFVPCDDGGWLEIRTLEGIMSASIGDWVIRGIKGEFYPCKPDIFEATYEPHGFDGSGEGAENSSITAHIDREVR